jgi:hypothetical protein
VILLLYFVLFWIKRHVASTSPPRHRHRTATSVPRGSHVSTTWQPRHRHVAATSATNSSLQVTWRVNPWRSLSSQILGFGLGSMGFTPIYNALRTSWITLIYDENLRMSREGIRDAQYMTFSNFDDPWRKLTVIDHEIFCSDGSVADMTWGACGCLWWSYD